MWNSWCPAIRMPSNRPNRTRPRTVIAMSQTNCVSLIYMLVEFVLSCFYIFSGPLTWQSVSKCRKLSRYCQNPVCRDANDNISASPNPHRTRAIDSSLCRVRTQKKRMKVIVVAGWLRKTYRNRTQTAPTCRWRKTWWYRLSCGPMRLAAAPNADLSRIYGPISWTKISCQPQTHPRTTTSDRMGPIVRADTTDFFPPRSRAAMNDFELLPKISHLMCQFTFVNNLPERQTMQLFVALSTSHRTCSIWNPQYSKDHSNIPWGRSNTAIAVRRISNLSMV